MVACFVDIVVEVWLWLERIAASILGLSRGEEGVRLTRAMRGLSIVKRIAPCPTSSWMNRPRPAPGIFDWWISIGTESLTRSGRSGDSIFSDSVFKVDRNMKLSVVRVEEGEGWRFKSRLSLKDASRAYSLLTKRKFTCLARIGGSER